MPTYHDYLKLGWPVFPIAGPAYAKNKEQYKTWKVPLVYWQKYQNILPTENEIASWLSKWPLAWIGCVTGKFSGLFVIDVDGEKGKKSLSEFRLALPPTRISQTQRGYHYFFKWSPRMDSFTTTTANLRPGIDIRGEGGCIVLPSADNRKWVSLEPIAELPESWYSIFAKEKRKSYGWRKTAIEEITMGNRHATFLSLASSCLNAQWSREEMLAVLRPLAIQHKFEDDLEELINDVVTRYSKEGRQEIMQRQTRRAVEKMPIASPSEMRYLSRTFPDIVHEMFMAQDAYDKESVAWLSSDKIWEGSLAEKALAEWARIVSHLKNCAVR